MISDLWSSSSSSGSSLTTETEMNPPGPLVQLSQMMFTSSSKSSFSSLLSSSSSSSCSSDFSNSSCPITPPSTPSQTFLSPSLPSLSLLFLSVFLIYYLSLAIYNVFFHPLSSIPGPFLAKFSESWLWFQCATLKRCWSIHGELGNNEGTGFSERKVVRIAPNKVAFQDVETFQKLYGKYAEKSPYYEGFLFEDSHHCMTLGSPESHSARRKLIAHSYTPQKVSQYESELVEFAGDALERIFIDGKGKKNEKGNHKDGGDEDDELEPVDLMGLIKHLMFDAIALVGFGKRLNIVKENKKHWVIESIHFTLMDFGMKAVMGPVYHLFKFIPSTFVKKIVSAQEKYNGFTRDILHSTREELELLGPDGISQDNLVTRMLKNSEKVKPVGGVKDSEMVAEMDAHLLAGTDTPSFATSFIAIDCYRQPRIWQKLYEEVCDLTEDPLVLPTSGVASKVNSCTYLGWVVKEALRLYAGTPSSLPRVVPKEGIMIDGHFIPGGIEASAQAWTSHRVKAVWGEDADECRPERWENETEEMRAHFMPFGLTGSPRHCPGHHLAILMIKLFLINLVRNFTLELAMPEKDLVLEDGFIVEPTAHKVLMKCRPRTRDGRIEE